MKFTTRSLVAAAAVTPLLAAGQAGAALQFTEFLVGGTGTENTFFEFTAGSTADLGPGAALLVINGSESSAGLIDQVLDLNIDFSPSSGNTFPSNNLFFAQSGEITNAQPGDQTGANPFLPAPSADTFFLGGGPFFFPVTSPSATYILAQGFTGAVGDDIDSNNDGTIDASIGWTADDAITLLDSSNNLADQVSSGATPAFTSVAYADDFGGIVFDQTFDENVGISPDGPDGFFRDTNGVPAVFDVNVEDDGLGFDGSTNLGGPNADEEIIAAIPDGNGGFDFVDTEIPSDSDPNTSGDQGPLLSPGNPSTITFTPDNLDQDPLPEPVPPSTTDLTDQVNFGTDIVTPAAPKIAGTSFEAEAGDTYAVLDEVTETADFNGDGDLTDYFIGFVSELVEGVDINGDGDTSDVEFVGYIEDATDGEDDGALSGVGNATGNGVATNTVVPLLNSSGDTEVQEGPDDIDGTADDVVLPSQGAVLNSTSASDTAGDLGFTSNYVDTRSTFESGLSDGDIVGVSQEDFLNFTDTPTDNRDGDNVFILSDTDGTVEVTFDAVDLSGIEGGQFSILIGVEDTGYEVDDELDIDLIYTLIDGSIVVVDALTLSGESGGIDLLDIFGDLVEDEGNGRANAQGLGQFITDIPDAAQSVQAVVGFSSSSGAENLLFDNVEFFGNAATFATGDFDEDGDIDIVDVDLLFANFGDAAFDLNLDDDATADDVAVLLAGVFDTVVGDANLDGLVETGDLAILAGNFNGNVTSYADGDF
ncbi:MAG: hypothetical protein AAF211_07940, partial [Myxococcota bacterium]